MFTESSWIWQNITPKKDEYTDYKFTVNKKDQSKYILNICVDSNYCVNINGSLAAFGQYNDYPSHRTYDSVDITGKLVLGDNTVVITAYYLGKNIGCYALGDAGVIFEVLENGNIVAFSSADTLSRISPYYKSHACEELNCFLGYLFNYDSTAVETDYGKSVEFEKPLEFFARPNEKLVLCDRHKSEIVRYGSFTYGNDESLGKLMQNSKRGNAQFKGNTVFADNDGVFAVCEIDVNSAGFAEFDIEVPNDCDIEIGYAELLDGDVCRTKYMGYCSRYRAKKGRNIFTGVFRRFGCKFIQLFAHTNSLKINYLGLRSTNYPITFKPFSTDNELRNKIYDVAKNTLICNMHEHYEDSCGREQAMYTLDSRNEMLFTYYSTGDTRFARSCLSLISRGLCEDAGFLYLTYPVFGNTFIPSYSLVYFLQVLEYLEITGDLSLGEEAYPVLLKLVNTFEKLADKRGIIANPTSEKYRIWNFYDWTRTMHDDPHSDDFEAPLNAWFSIALQSMAKITEILNKGNAGKYLHAAKSINDGIVKVFFEKDKRVFKSFENKNIGLYSVYTQALCVLCGAADNVDSSIIADILRTNGKINFGLDIDADTLASCCFRYDALNKLFGDKYNADIIADIDETYGKMISEGATSFWETAIGADDMDYTASLCHAWSSAPLKYYRQILLGEKL